MNPTRLPPLTAAQVERVRLHRQEWKGVAKVSVIRKGQKPGHVCIAVTEPDKIRRYWYDEDARLVSVAIERPLFTLTATVSEPDNALLQNTQE